MARYYHFVGEHWFFFVLTRANHSSLSLSLSLSFFFLLSFSLSFSSFFLQYQKFSHPPHISRVSLLSTRKSNVVFSSDNPSWFSILPRIRKLCPFITVIHGCESSHVSEKTGKLYLSNNYWYSYVSYLSFNP